MEYYSQPAFERDLPAATTERPVVIPERHTTRRAMTPGVAIIGCGLIGQKRARAITPARLVVCADRHADRAEAAARAAHGVAWSTRWQDAIGHPDVDIVIVATSNEALTPIALEAIAHGKHVLIEKPAGRSVCEIDALLAAANAHGRAVRVGFNHRFHPALLKAREFVDSGVLGELMFVRARYGHGGRIGYEKEWRGNPLRSGGGELIDQGIHLIDLARWFLGDFTSVDGFARTYFWNMPVDDNAFLLLRTRREQTAFLHASCTEWKNLFSFEMYGRDAKLHIEGLGGSYGVERIAYYEMRPEMGPPDTTIWEFPGADVSWQREFTEFLEDIALGRTPSAGLAEARAALVVVEAIYSRSGYDFEPVAARGARVSSPFA
jgi:predicted dehydrogenase